MVNYREEYYKLLDTTKKEHRRRVLSGLSGKEHSIMQLIYLAEDHPNDKWFTEIVLERIKVLREKQETKNKFERFVEWLYKRRLI